MRKMDDIRQKEKRFDEWYNARQNMFSKLTYPAKNIAWLAWQAATQPRELDSFCACGEPSNLDIDGTCVICWLPTYPKKGAIVDKLPKNISDYSNAELLLMKQDWLRPRDVIWDGYPTPEYSLQEIQRELHKRGEAARRERRNG